MKEEQAQEPELVDAESAPALVAAMFAGSQDEAERCCDLLKENGIPATVGELGDGKRSRGAGIPLLVPESLLENASEILSARTDDEEEVDIDGAEGSDEDEDGDEDFDDDYDDEDEFEAEDEESWDDDDDEVEEDEDYE